MGIRKLVAANIALIMLMLSGLVMVGCEDREKVEYYYKIYLENSDGTHTMWSSKTYWTDGPLVCWYDKHSNVMCKTSGRTLTVLRIPINNVKNSDEAQSVKNSDEAQSGGESKDGKQE